MRASRAHCLYCGTGPKSALYRCPIPWLPRSACAAPRGCSVSFSDGSRFELPFEYLRVHSPSAEVKGHGPGQEVLVLGKENVGIRAVEPVGQYAITIVFDDGHDTGLFTWRYLHELGRERAANADRSQERR